METLLRSRDRDRVITVTQGQTPLGLIPILHLEVIETDIIQAEAMVPLDHHIQGVGDPPVTVLDPEAPEVEAEAVLEADNINLNITTMKKYIPHVLVLLLFPMGTYSQSIDDLLRYTRTELKGTARYVAMGGAFNALGGDFSAIKDNPAAAAVFLNSEIELTLNSIKNGVGANYFGNSTLIDSRSSDLDQFGFVLVLNDTDASDFVKLTFAYNYQNEHNFNSKFNARGVNPNRGLDDYFLAFANGIPYKDIKTYEDENISQSYKYLGENNGFESQQAFLGYQSYVINPVKSVDTNTLYLSNSNPDNRPVNHNFFVTQSGKNSKHTFSLGSQYGENLYLGFNLNSHQTRFRRIDNLIENNYGGSSTFDYTEFENDLLSLGEGFSFQLGAIYKADNLRVGLSYHSPVWYQMTDELLQFIITNKTNGKDAIDPRVINIYEYNMSTPFRYSGGLAYVFGSKGLISVQYDLVNYQNASFDVGNGDENFIKQNKIINDTLKSAGTLKIGGEYRLGRLSLRGGYFNQESINKKSADLSKGSSFGLGYDFGGSALNFGFSNLVFERSEPLYQDGLTDPVELNKDQFQFLVSYSLKL